MRQVDDGSAMEDDSQATQLLQAILQPSDSSGRTSVRGPTQEEEQNISIVSDAPSRGAKGHYHYHGLVTTQTEPQLVGEEGESPQKDGLHATKRPRGGITSREGPSRPPSAPSSKTSQPGARIDDRGGLSRGTKPSSTINKAVSFKSPAKSDRATQANPTTRTSSRTQPKRAPVREQDEESSQDSFAGAVYQDPAKQFLASSRQFDVPLAELGRVVAENAGSRTTMRGATSRARYPNPRGSSPIEGTVLVESTPSLSGSSQSQSQPSQNLYEESCRQPDYMDLDPPIDQDRKLSSQSTEECLSDAPSSLYERRDRDNDFPPPHAINDGPPTQLSTQVEEDYDQDMSTQQEFATGASGDPPRTAASSKVPPSRGLLGMIDPKKLWRYQHYQNRSTGPQLTYTHSAPAQTADSMAVEATQPSTVADLRMPSRQFPPRPRPSSPPRNQPTIEETQPSFEDQEMAKLPQRQFPTRSRPLSAPKKSTREPSPSRVDTEDERMDVVPDSEPLQMSSPEVRKGPRGHPTLKTSHVSDGELNIVPDSVVEEEATKSAPQSESAESDEDEDEDVPLAQKIPIRSSKQAGKGKETVLPPKATVKTKQASTGGRSTRSTARTPTPETKLAPSTRKAAGFSKPKATQEIPSSVPQQDLVKPTKARTTRAPTTKAAKGKGKGKGKAPPVSRGRPKSKRAKSRDEEEESVTESEDELAMAMSLKEEAEEIDADEEFEEEPAGPSRKRKRTATTSKTSTKGKGKAVAHTPLTRQTKRLQIVASASRPGANNAHATRVFALWKPDGCWYPGFVYSHEGGDLYQIKFDDGSDGLATVDQMRSCDVRAKDQIMVTNTEYTRYRRSVPVEDASKLAISLTISVHTEGKIVEVPIRFTKISAKTISFAWEDRTISQDSIIPMIQPEGTRSSPALSGASTETPANANRLFAKTGFVVTVGATADYKLQKSSVMRVIKNTGGTVIEDWGNVIRMEGTHTHSNNRWIIQKREAHWMGKGDIERVFLIADDPSHKAKFLIALALGVPCVSAAWIIDSSAAANEKAWSPYLLSQGFSDGLNCRLSQQIDMDWGDTIHHLTTILESKVAFKLFDKKSILCLGPEMVPHAKGKRAAATDEKGQEANNAVPRIIFSMGAESVEAVTELKYASASIADYDFVVIKEPRHYTTDLKAGRTVHWPWVKACLIASQQLPLPVWGGNDESQDL